MFNKSSGGKRPPGTDTIIGQSTRFEGKIYCETDLHVEGQVNGDIQCLRDVIVGETGKLTSVVHANNLILSGQLDGDVIVAGSCIIEPTGKLTGEVVSGTFIIHEGGIFNGVSRMNTSATSSDKQKTITVLTETAVSSE